MRYLLFSFINLIGLAGYSQPVQFKLTVYPKNSRIDKNIYLKYDYIDTIGNIKVDKRHISDDRVVFEGKIYQPGKAVIYQRAKLPFNPSEFFNADQSSLFNDVLSDDAMELPFEFYLVPGETTIDLRNEDPHITGSAAVKDFESLRLADEKDLAETELLLEELSVCQSKNDNVCKAKVEEKMHLFFSKKKNRYRNYYQNNLGSPLALYALKESMNDDSLSSGNYQELFSKLSKQVRELPEAVALSKILKAAADCKPGKRIENFEQSDMAGHKVTLGSFSGNYVLLHFWESTDPVNRIMVSDLFPIWDKYQKRNFKIISIGMETHATKEQWLKTIASKKLKWTHLTDFKGYLNTAALQFGVLKTPSYFLVDPAGKIVRKLDDVRKLGDYLEKILK